MNGFLHSAWYVVALPEEIARVPLRRVVLGAPIVFFRREDGGIAALSDICPHRFAPLSKGALVGDRISCPYHGLTFDADGTCTHNPNGNGVIPRNATLRRYPAAERYGLVWLWMGDVREADPSAIPDFTVFETDYRAFAGHMQVAANYQLLNDNILDGGAHVDFIHKGLKPAGEYTRTSEFRREGDTVHSDAWWLGGQLNDLMRGLWPDLDRADVYNFVRWDAPATVLLYAGLRHLDGTPDDGPLGPAAHFFTPESETTTHDFWVVSRKASLDDRLDGFLRQSGNTAFEMEDRPMIELQQVNLAGRDFNAMKPISLSTDGAALLARKILAQKIAEEAASRRTAPVAAE